MTKAAKDLINAAPVQWASLTEKAADLAPVRKDLDANALHAARLAGYVSAREMGRDHAEAVKAGNKAAVTLAKALGYSYPNLHTVSF